MLLCPAGQGIQGKRPGAALAEIVKDPQANGRARDYALEAIAIHGGKAGLQALTPALKDDADMTRKLEKAMQKAK